MKKDKPEVKDDKLDLKYIRVDLIEPNTWNPQVMDTTEFACLCKEITEVGFIDPIQVIALDTGKYRIIGGEHRWEAAKKVGLDEVPCGVIRGVKWKSEDLQKFVTTRLNLIGGKMDPEKFLKLYEEMAEKYGADQLQDLFGWTDAKAFAKILGGIQKSLKKALPKEMHGAIDAAAKEAKSIEDLTNIVQMLFHKYGDTVGQSFMVFSYGKSQHLYVRMDAAMNKAMKVVTDHCRKTGADINTFLAPLTKVWAEEAKKSLPGAGTASAPAATGDDPEVEF